MQSKTIAALAIALLAATNPFKSLAQDNITPKSSGLNSLTDNVSIERTIDELKNENKKLNEKNAELESRLNQIEKDLAYKSGAGNSEFGETSNSAVGKIWQNTPNPFKEKTVIKYFVPSDASSAFIKIYSLFGSELLSFPITTKGFGQIEFSGKTLSAGTFTYILLVDEKAVDTKQMVLTK